MARDLIEVIKLHDGRYAGKVPTCQTDHSYLSGLKRQTLLDLQSRSDWQGWNDCQASQQRRVAWGLQTIACPEVSIPGSESENHSCPPSQVTCTSTWSNGLECSLQSADWIRFRTVWIKCVAGFLLCEPGVDISRQDNSYAWSPTFIWLRHLQVLGRSRADIPGLQSKNLATYSICSSQSNEPSDSNCHISLLPDRWADQWNQCLLTT